MRIVQGGCCIIKLTMQGVTVLNPAGLSEEPLEVHLMDIKEGMSCNEN